jgi:chain length determinant protein (polysaccharide antigen chain regulator)
MNSPENAPHNTSTRPEYDDEIDLFELFQNLWDQKWLIAGITAVTTVLGIVAALIMTPTYQSEARLLPPLAQNVQEFSVGVSGVDMSRDAVYAQLKTNLNSISLRRQFFEENVSDKLEPNPEQTPFERFEKNFNEKLQVSSPSGRDADTSIVVVTLEGKTSEQVAQWTNEFIEFTVQFTKQELVERAQFVIQSEVNKITNEIVSKRSIASSRIEDRIARLSEALIVARAMGLEKPMIENAANQLNMEYMRGSISIAAEIKVLQDRESNDPFIDGVRNMQERIAFLNGLQIDPANIRVARIDQAAEIPTSPIKPKKKLIVAVALVLGGMLGVFIALIRSAVRKRRQTLEQTA